MICILINIIGAIANAIISAFTYWPVDSWSRWYRPIVTFIGTYVGIFLILFFLLWLTSRFVDVKKERTKPDRYSRFIFTEALKYVNFHAHAVFHLRGQEKLPHNCRFLLVCNHRSNFDSLLFSDRLWKKDIAFVSKDANFKLPIVNRFMRGLMYIGIDRSDLVQSLQVMRTAENYIVNNYCSVGVFPEGTRQSKEIIGEFHEGCFNVALRAKCPIVIATVKHTEKIKKRFPFLITRVKAEIVGTLEYEDFEDKTAKEISDEVRQIMIDNLSHKKYVR